LRGQGEAEVGNIQVHIGRTQQCLDIYIQAAACIRRIQDTTLPEMELAITHYIARLPPVDVLNKCAKMLASTSAQLGIDVEDIRLRLDRLVSHIQANEAAQQGRRLQETHLVISSSSPSQPHHARVNIFQAISAAEGSQQILVSTSGNSIHAQNVTTGPQSSQWMGQMSDVSLQLLSENACRARCE
jgi:hypothetical protein